MAEDRANGRTGFAGLESLASEVETGGRPAASLPPGKPESVAPVPKPAQGTEKQMAAAEPLPPAGVGAVSPLLKPDQSAMKRSRADGVGPPGGSQAAGWLVLIGIVVVVMLAVAFSGPKNRKAHSAVSVRPAAPSASEQRPPVGSSLVLNEGQIRYCLSEDIRLSAWSNGVNNFSRSSVDAYNAAVADYNARCSRFRYRRGSLESVRVQVEANRTSLQQQGALRAALNP